MLLSLLTELDLADLDRNFGEFDPTPTSPCRGCALSVENFHVGNEAFHETKPDAVGVRQRGKGQVPVAMMSPCWMDGLLSVAGGAIVVAAVDRLHELSGGPRVDFEVPAAVAFAEVEAVAVDFAGPLFGREKTLKLRNASRVATAIWAAAGSSARPI